MKLLTITVLVFACLCSALSFNSGRDVEIERGTFSLVWVLTPKSDGTEENIPLRAYHKLDISEDIKQAAVDRKVRDRKTTPHSTNAGKRTEFLTKVPEFRLTPLEELL